MRSYPRGLIIGLRLDPVVASGLYDWVRATFPDRIAVPAEHMHCTLVMTGKNIKQFSPLGAISVPLEKPQLRTFKGRTDRALILTFEPTWFNKREAEIRAEIDAKGKGGLNIPHVTLCYDFPPLVPLKEYPLPDLPYRFAEEYAQAYNRQWKYQVGVV